MERETEQIRQEIVSGKTVLGIELGSTGIKEVLMGEDYTSIASGGYCGRTDWNTMSGRIIWRIFGRGCARHM